MRIDRNDNVTLDVKYNTEVRIKKSSYLYNDIRSINLDLYE